MNDRLENHLLQVRDEKQIAVISCGKQIAEPGHSVPPRVYPSFSLTFVLRGCGTYTTAKNTYRVTAGTGFLIASGSTVSYTADRADPWEYIFVMFRGDGCKELLSLAKLSGDQPLFSFRPEGETLRNLNELLRVCREDRAAGYDALGYFLILVSGLFSRSPSPRSGHDRYLRDVVNYIEANYNRNVSVEELSEHFFMDRSGIYRMFEQAFGISPKKYILRCRLLRVAKQLSETDVCVTDAALSAGFFDHSHFNKAFRAIFGMSPTEYRRK